MDRELLIESSLTCFLSLSDSGLVLVQFPFDAVTHFKLRKIRPFGVWKGTTKQWEFPFAAFQELKKELGGRFVIKSDLSFWAQLSNDSLPPWPSEANLSEESFPTTLLDGRKPLWHQIQGALWLLAHQRALLADEMGLGKTITALLAARALLQKIPVSVMVIAPMGLHEHWKKEAASLELNIDLVSWARLPNELIHPGTLLIVDEAHFAQSINTKRTKALLRLARHPWLTGIWMLTGTPMRNGRLAELLPLMAAMKNSIMTDQNVSEIKSCHNYLFQDKYQLIEDSKKGKELNLFKASIRPLMLHRSKEKVLKLTAKIRKIHNITLTKSIKIGFEHRLNIVTEDYRYRVQMGFASPQAEALVFLTAMRQISAEFKLPDVATFLTNLLLNGDSIVIFSSFIKPLKLLQNKLGGVLLTGLQTLEERSAAVKQFQLGTETLLFATYGAGGLGLTLHRAEHVVFLERPWTPGELLQAEDRCHRIGMKGSLTSHWFKLGVADELVDDLIIKKSKAITTMIDTESCTSESTSLKELISCYFDINN